ncbi:MAG: hypothetical protein IPM07_29960 [Anaerolineales bacterium]|nr:hypothetical protein [Anaerolineales bacterium]
MQPAEAASNATQSELAALEFVLSPAAAPLLEELAQASLDEAHTLTLLTRLRRTVAPALATALLTQARLRRRAQVKFTAAARMVFTAEALEQATAETPAAQRGAA